MARRVFKVRKVLAKLLIKALEEARVDHLPMARPLWMTTQDDSYNVGDPLLVSDEYMIGECLLVAPILDEATLHRTVIFPEGSWVPCLGDGHDVTLTSSGNLTVTVKTLSLTDDPPCYRRSDIADCSL